MKMQVVSALCVAWCFGLPTTVSSEEPRSDEQLLRKQLELIKPTWRESSWAQVPWMLDLTAARKKAAAEGKPLYVWSMSGAPLGQC